ncbi:MAG: autotransporter-associated beta strand repeat-containing protein, partial [Kiritimatiellaeota bacterium]|nr:autotransporter-associated beta strand repeat-containing protein [Kiritimatiellota bacterium]
MKTSTCLARLILAVVGWVLTWGSSAQAQTIKKANNTDALSLTTSWALGAVPIATQIAEWDSTVLAANSTLIGDNLTWQGLKISNPGGLVTIGATATKTLTLGTSGIDLTAATQSLTINAAAALSGNQTWDVLTSRVLTLNGAVAAGGTTLTVQGAGQTDLLTGGVGLGLSGSGTLIKTGSGNLRMAGNNSANTHAFTGAVWLKNGQIENPQNLANISGITLGDAGAPATVTLYVAANPTTLPTWSRNIILAAGCTGEIKLNTTSNWTLSGVISGAGNLKPTVGTGVLTLAGANTYTGTTTLSTGILRATDNIGLPGALSTGGGSYLRLDGAILESSGNFTRVNSTTANGANFQWMSANGGGFSANSGKLTVTINNSAATEQVWGTAAANNAIWGILKFGSTTANAETEFRNNIDLNNGTRTVDVTAGTGGDFATLSGVIRTSSGTGGLTKTGAGTLVLSGANIYNGITTVSTGVLRLNSANALPGGIGTVGGTSALTFNGGVLGLGNGDFTRSLAAAGTVTGANFTGSGGWAADGADRLVNLGGASALITWATPNTGFNGQTLILGASTATHMVTLQNPIDVGAAYTVQVDNGAAAIDATMSGSISGVGGLTKSGEGTLALTGANSYSGNTLINAGTVIISGANSSGGTIQFGSGVVATTILQLNNASNGGLASGTFAFGNGTLQALSAPRTLSNNITWATGATTISGAQSITLNGTVTLSAGNRTLTSSITGGNTLTLAGNVYLNDTAAAGRILTVAGTGTTTISGIIANYNGVGGTAGGLTITSTGLTILSGVNTYTGVTTVNTAGAMLRINGNQSAATNAVNVSGAGAALGGTGTIGGAVTVSSTAGIDLRDGAVGILTLSTNLAITGAAGANNLKFDLGAAAAGTDKIAAAGAVSMTTAGAGVINLNQLGGVATRLTAGTYDLITGSSVPSSANFTLATTKAFGQTFSLANPAGTALQLTTTQITSVTPTAFWAGSSDANWSTAANWKTDATSNVGAAGAPDYQSDVTFYTTTPAAANLTTTVNADFDINSLTFSAAATAPVTIATGAQTLTIEAAGGSGITLNNTSGTHTISGKLFLAGPQTWTVASGGTLNMNSTVNNNGNDLTINTEGTSKILIDAEAGYVIRGAGSLIKTGSGTLSFNDAGGGGGGGNNHAFTGSLWVKSGVVQSGKTTLDIGNVAEIKLGDSTGTTGTLYFTRTNTGITWDNPQKNITLVTGGTGELRLANTFTLTLDGVLSGGGSLLKSGDPTSALVLSGINTYSGTTTVSTGSLTFAKRAALYTGALANWTAANIMVASNATLGVNVGGTGEFTAGDVTTLLTNLGGAVNNNGLQAGSTIAFNTANAASGTFTVADNLADSTGPGGGAIGVTKLGANTLVLSGASSYTGATTISAGTLITAGANSSAGATILSAGTLQLNSASNGGLAGGTLTLGGGALQALTASRVVANNTLLTVNTTIAGAQNLTFQTGAFTQSGGDRTLTSSITGGNTLTLAGNVYLSEITGTGRTLTLAGAGNTTISGAIANFNGGAGTAGGLTITNTGLTILSGANTYTGVTTISAGTLQIGAGGTSGALSASGTITNNSVL